MLPNVDFAGGMEIFVGILDGLTSSVFGLLEFPFLQETFERDTWVRIRLEIVLETTFQKCIPHFAGKS